MEYDEFEKNLLFQLANDNEESINTVLSNEKLVKEYLQNSEKPIHIKSLVNGINDIILNKYKYFDIIEKVLTTESMKCVYSEFINSNIMILACKQSNTIALKWLLKMNINPCIVDENGMTALMYAAKNDLVRLTPQLIQGGDHINFVDKNNENALFHALNNPNSFKELLHSNIDINHINKEGDSVLLYCCRNDLFKNIYNLSDLSELDYNITDKEGRNALMYVLDHEYYFAFSEILKKIKKNNNKFNINYRNKNNDNESIMSIFIKKYYAMYCDKIFIKKTKEDIYIITGIALAFGSIISCPGCDINIPIDEDDNTAIMVFMMLNDSVMVNFTISCCKDIDLGIRNKKGISASVLAMNLRNEDNLIKVLIRHKSFDLNFVDICNNNLLMYSVFFKNELAFLKLIMENEKMLLHVNDKNEDAIIVGTKLGIIDSVNSYNIRNANFNQQDQLGNSALFYAVKLKNKYVINLLSYCHSDPNLKNKQGMSPMDLAKQLEEKDLIKILNKPKPIHEMKKQLQKIKQNKSDKKIEDYIKNYQINNYYEDYKNFTERAITYTAEPLPIEAMKQLGVILYICLDRCSYQLIKCMDPYEEYDERKSGPHKRNMNREEYEYYLIHTYEITMLTSVIL